MLLMVGASRCIPQAQEIRYVQHSLALVPYDLHHPDSTYKLDKSLYEISGLTYIAPNTLGAIEDESGWLYWLDTRSGEILEKIKFGKKGDYEAVEFINDRYFVIESKGDLHTFKVRKKEAKNVQIIDTGFSGKNDVEGMGHQVSQLWFACKADGSIATYATRNKALYTMNINDKQLGSSPIMEISLEGINAFLKKNGRDGKAKEFDPSGVAIHPLTSKIYVLSADQMLVVLSTQGKIEEVIFLDPRIYEQPEGICFDPRGIMYISSEGVQRRARLFMYAPKPLP